MSGSVTLTKRLSAIAGMIPSCDVLCDVGTDHAYLPIYAVSEGVAKKAFAVDVRRGPLERAESNIFEADLSDKITTVLSDGLDKIEPGSCDVISISGMGGFLMEDILSRGRKTAREADCLILSPQSDLSHFRAFLSKEGYHIKDEAIVASAGKFYFIMKVAYENLGQESLSPLELGYGKILTARRDPVLLDFMRAEQKRLLKIAESLRASGSDEKRLSDILNEIKVIKDYDKDPGN